MHAVDDRTQPVRPSTVFRLWITGYSQWRPTSWADTPPLATALEPVSQTTYSAEDAQLFLEGFNSQMLSDERELWVVAVPVTLRFEGDVRAGDEIRGSEVLGSQAGGGEYALPSDDAARLAAASQPDQGFSQSPHRSR